VRARACRRERQAVGAPRTRLRPHHHNAHLLQLLVDLVQVLKVGHQLAHYGAVHQAKHLAVLLASGAVVAAAAATAMARASGARSAASGALAQRACGPVTPAQS
jgi:hypothetical protein